MNRHAFLTSVVLCGGLAVSLLLVSDAAAAQRSGGGRTGQGAGRAGTRSGDRGTDTARTGGGEPSGRAGTREREREGGGDQVAPQAANRQPGPPRGGGGRVVVVPGYGYYPWGWGGIGFGYYGGWWDPWWDGRYGYAPYQVTEPAGGLRLKVTPPDAEVFVEGSYAGQVGEFDGAFQSLPLPEGPHHLEIRAHGFETLTLDVWIQRDHTITYQADLKPLAQP